MQMFESGIVTGSPLYPVRLSRAALAYSGLGSMASIIAKFLETIGANKGIPEVERPSGKSCGSPRIEPGSALETIAVLNPSTAITYADAVASEIKQAIATCTIEDPETTTVQLLEQIHSLKNAIAPTGSRELLKGCEQLRLDASHSVPRSVLAQDFMTVASAATLLVRNFRHALSRDAKGPS
jgi:hypothetical protein